MTIPYIEVQLCVWGDWANRHAARAIGYPSTSPMFNDAPRGDGFGSAEPLGVEEYVYDTDQAVRRLGPEMRALCVQVYQIRGRSADIARRMGIGRSTLYAKLGLLHRQVEGHLNDIAAGV
jgi:hypothetical protein